MTETGQALLIRRATPADIDGLVACGVGLFTEDAAGRDPMRNAQWARQHAAAAYLADLADPDKLLLVADHEGAVVGKLLGMYHGPSDMWVAARAYLVSMFVQPRWRGHAAGSRLVAEFTAWARGRGAAQLRVTAYSANEGAVRFYTRHGFLPLETTFAADLGADPHPGRPDRPTRPE